MKRHRSGCLDPSASAPYLSSMSALLIKNLRFRYARSDDWIVDVKHLALANAQQMLLTGGSGRGKSTLLHVIAGLENPQEGTVEIDGEDMHQLRGHKRDEFRGRSIGMIFQNFNLLHGFTALENVMAPMMFSDLPKKEHKDRAKSLLSHLGIDWMNARPDQLSIGQQQRVAVARALACEPVLVLADEPTASLDPENASTAMDLIQSACRDQNAALLCVSHDPSMLERFEHHQTFDQLATGTAEAEAVGV